MKRLLAGLLVVCATFANLSSEAQAAPRRYPPRYERGTYFPILVQKQRNGQITTRQVYPGYKNGFPPPAWLYYGYPHGGDGLVSPGF